TQYVNDTPVATESGGAPSGFVEAVKAGASALDLNGLAYADASIRRYGATTAYPAGTATVQDFAQLGVFNQAQLSQLATMAPNDLGQLYKLAAQNVEAVIRTATVTNAINTAASPTPAPAASPVPNPAAGPATGTSQAQAVPTAATPAMAIEQQWEPTIVAAFRAAGANDATITTQLTDAVAKGVDDAGYKQLLEYLKTPQAKADIAASQAPQSANTDTPGAENRPDPTPGGPPAWSDAWADKLRAALVAAGASGPSLVATMRQLEESKPNEAQLTAALAQLKSPEIKKSMKELNTLQAGQGREVTKAMAQQAAIGLLTSGAVGGVAIARGRANLARQLEALSNTTKDPKTLAAVREVSAAKANVVGVSKAGAGAQLATKEALLARASELRAAGNSVDAKAMTKAASMLTAGERMTWKQALKAGVTLRTPEMDAKAAAKSAERAAATTATKAATGGGEAAGAAATATKGAAKAAASAAVGDAAKGAAAFSKAASGFGRIALKALGPVALTAQAGLGAWEVHKTIDAEGGFKKESAKKTGEVAGQTAGGVIGMTIGSALGSLLPTGITTALGGFAGMAVGSWVGGLLGQGAGGGIYDAMHGADHVKKKK
ncbi:MAG: hypothetical protein JWQ41_2931, partial [Variovorax sp.]|nr:hypothetical protein [Variovorax sp.]